MFLLPYFICKPASVSIDFLKINKMQSICWAIIRRALTFRDINKIEAVERTPFQNQHILVLDQPFIHLFSNAQCSLFPLFFFFKNFLLIGMIMSREYNHVDFSAGGSSTPRCTITKWTERVLCLEKRMETLTFQAADTRGSQRCISFAETSY